MAAEERSHVDMKEAVAFLNKYPLLSKATCDNDKPTPGYLYRDISKITFESGAYCSQLLEYLLKRLGKKSPHVKIKVLKILRHVISDGCSEFRVALRKQDANIKEAIGWSGPPDLLHGNAHNMAVRREAAEVLQLLYDSEVIQEDTAVAQQARSADATPMFGMGSNVKPGKYEGFGNTPFANSRTMTERVMDSLVGVVDRLLRPYDPDALSLDSDPGQYEPPTLLTAPSTSSGPSNSVATVAGATSCSTAVAATAASCSTAVAAAAAAATAVAVPVIASRRSNKRKVVHRPGRAGGGWENDASADDVTSSHSKQFVSAAENPASSRSNSVSTDSLDKEEVELDWSNEVNMVESIATETEPVFTSFRTVEEVIESAGAMNWEKVVELLPGRLSDSESDTLQLRVLLLVEMLLHLELVTMALVQMHLASILTQLQLNTAATVQAKAKKIFLMVTRLQAKQVDAGRPDVQENAAPQTVAL